MQNPCQHPDTRRTTRNLLSTSYLCRHKSPCYGCATQSRSGFVTFVVPFWQEGDLPAVRTQLQANPSGPSYPIRCRPITTIPNATAQLDLSARRPQRGGNAASPGNRPRNHGQAAGPDLHLRPLRRNPRRRHGALAAITTDRVAAGRKAENRRRRTANGELPFIRGFRRLTQILRQGTSDDLPPRNTPHTRMQRPLAFLPFRPNA